MKILFIAPFPPPVTGQSVAAKAFYTKLKSDGNTIVTINLSKNNFHQGINSFGRIIEIIHIIWRTWRAGADFDMVYLTTAESLAGNLKDILLLTFLGRLQKKTWLHLHGGAGMRRLLSRPDSWLGRLNKFYLMRVSGLIILGERLAPIFESYLPPDHIHVVNNFADDTLFKDQNYIDQKWANTEPLRVLFLSNMLPGKGHEEMLLAIESLPSDLVSGMQFDFAGDFESDEDRDRVLSIMKKLPNVKYHGVVHGNAKQELLAKAHVFCLPTSYPFEGQPISILEAYASGCAVLTTDHSGIFDIFTPGVNGWEVRAHDSESIITALLSIYSKPTSGAAIAHRNRRKAELKYTKSAHLRKMYTVLGLGG